MYHHVTKAKIKEVVKEFVVRQVYPEWFRDPQSFLKIALQPARIKRNMWIKREEEFYPLKTYKIPLEIYINPPIPIANCL